MAREVTMPSRAYRTKDGVFHPEEPLTASYEPHEEAFMRAMKDRIAALAPGEERTALINEVRTIHEAKALLGATMAPPDPAEIPPTETLKMFEDLEKQDSRLRVPDRVKAMFAEGQTVLPDAPPATRLPYSERDDTERLMRADPEPPAWSTPSPVSAPDSAVSRLPDFDGETYWSALDHERLGKQLLRVGRQMADGHWHTLAEISKATGDPEASISARLRDLRKRKFGGHTVNRERSKAHHGMYRYRLVREQFATPWEDEEVEDDPAVQA